MKRPLNKSFAVLSILLILFATNFSFAQNAKRIQFPKGKNTTTVKGTGNQTFVFGANERQHLIIDIESVGDKATFEVTSPDGSLLTNQRFKGHDLECSLDEKGDYTIEVTAPGKFSLEITIKSY